MLKRLLLVVVAVVAIAFPAAAERRVALVVGNGAYTAQPVLANPRNDASAMARMLREQLGFEIIATVLDGNLDAMDAAVDRFGRAAQNADIALFFYAGHGLEVNGENMLVPIEARLRDERDVRRQAVALADVLEAMKGARAKIVLLDACRDNPVARTMQRSTRSGTPGNGLAELREVPEGMLIAYAAAPGRTAADGRGNHSPFTTALLEVLPRSTDEIRLVLGDVSQSVMTATRREQQPWVNFTAMSGRLYLRAPPEPTPAPRPQPGQQPAVVAPRVAVPQDECDRLAEQPHPHMGSVPFFASGVYSPDIDAPLAITACQRAVAAWPNEARFHSQLGRALERSGRPAEALVAFRRAAAMGYAPAQTILAFAAERGDLGVKQDLTEAVRLYRLAADQGMALAQTNLAVLLRDGRGAPRDPVAAFSLLQSAATYPFGPAISNLAWLFEQGLGTAANPGEALRLYRIAAGPGLFDVFAQYRLGGMFERGELGMPQDRAQAVAMYRAAARQGEQNSITALRRMGEREPW